MTKEERKAWILARVLNGFNEAHEHERLQREQKRQARLIIAKSKVLRYDKRKL